MKTNTLLLLAAGVGAYMLWKKQQAATSTAGAQASTIAPVTPAVAATAEVALPPPAVAAAAVSQGVEETPEDDAAYFVDYPTVSNWGGYGRGGIFSRGGGRPHGRHRGR